MRARQVTFGDIPNNLRFTVLSVMATHPGALTTAAAIPIVQVRIGKNLKSTQIPGPVEPRRLAAECRNLLRESKNPDRLRHNTLAQAVLAFTSRPWERQLLLEDVVSRALAHLRPRERAIVQRCDIDREAFIDVARELGISRRHLFRERRRTLERVARFVQSFQKEKAIAQVQAVVSFDGHLRTSRVLEENGDGKTAADIIDRLAGECSDPERQSTLFLKLAELHGRAGRFVHAQEYIALAEVTANGLRREDAPLLPARILVTRASVAEESGLGVDVAALAAQAANIVRNVNTYRYDREAATVLLESLLLGARSHAACGRRDDLARACNEATEMFALVQNPDENSQMDLLFAVHLRELFCNNDFAAARTALSRAANIARSAGYTLTSMQHIRDLAALFRIQREPSKAVETLTDIVPIVRGLGHTTALIDVLVELANSYLDLGQCKHAQPLLVEASELRSEHKSLAGTLLRALARVSLRLKKPGEALEVARGAETLFAALGKTRLVGPALRLQAQALSALGQRKAAIRTVSHAIEIIGTTNTSAALGHAYDVLGRITGDDRYFSKAQVLGKQSRPPLA